MNGFIVNLDIIDTFCDNCCRETNQKSVTIDNVSQTVALKCDYFLNVISCSEKFCTVLIQNGVFSIIRNIYINYDMQICIPNKCGKHIVTLGVDISPAI